jgi:hypothetical protein
MRAPLEQGALLVGRKEAVLGHQHVLRDVDQQLCRVELRQPGSW